MRAFQSRAIARNPTRDFGTPRHPLSWSLSLSILSMAAHDWAVGTDQLSAIVHRAQIPISVTSRHDSVVRGWSRALLSRGAHIKT